jgi:hypothetical protein
LIDGPLENYSRWQVVNKQSNGKMSGPCQKSSVGKATRQSRAVDTYQRKYVSSLCGHLGGRTLMLPPFPMINDQIERHPPRAENPIDQCSLLTHPWDIPLFCCSENQCFLLAPTCGYNPVVFLYFLWSYSHFHCDVDTNPYGLLSELKEQIRNCSI